ncbi:hypothetical protein ABZ897_44965 [Nonomuraea sp. NPDC046802]|uniref:hypothetical protein n=1 Tax=Nonomuraea sp. NPDC046802 TaxID=3154919 RepID=UPI0033CBA569
MPATETVPADTETAVIIPTAAAPLTAPDSPDTATPDTDPATDIDGRVAAVWAVLESLPGGSATGIGAAAGLSRVAAAKILNQMEADGLVRREPGVNDGTTRGRAADRWYPITTDPAEPTDTADASTPAPESPEASDAAPAATPAPDTDTPNADAVPAPDEEALQPAIGSADPAPADEPTDDEEELIGDEATGQGCDGTDGELGSVPDADASGPVRESVADDPAWARARAELTELANLIGGVITAKDGGNAVMALGCLEMAMAKVASAHRNARAVLTGTAAPARPAAVARPGAGGGASGSVRTGGLRDMVHAHLIEFPDKEFTPYEIGRVLDRSSGAVANALDRLVSLGDAVLATERPRRFALAPTANPTPADADDEGGSATDTYDG